MQKIKTYGKQISKKVLTQIPVLKNYIHNHNALVKAYADRFNEIGFPPGHYYSPIPSLEEIKENENEIFENETIPDINLNVAEQLQLLNELKDYYSSIPYRFREPALGNHEQNITNLNSCSGRYIVKDAWYRYSDVIFLIAMMRHFKPKRVIEIGSGHSSAVMLDTNETFLHNRVDFTFIEPFPEERLLEILRENDKKRVTIIKSKIQKTDIDLFLSLEENDILFIDSTHVSKIGSDVNYIFFEILPVLKPGVLIHFHDIFYPFEFPRHWIFEKKWFWNEIYILRAFLMNNRNYKILLFNSMLHQKYKEWFEKEMPDCLLGKEDTGSIWIKKMN